MAGKDAEKFAHLFLLEGAQSEKFARRGGRNVEIPDRDRERHGAKLRLELDEISNLGAERSSELKKFDLGEPDGLILKFVGFPDIDLAFESLSRERQGIELLNIRNLNDRLVATVFVPNGQLTHFENLLQDYLEERKREDGTSYDHRALINTIESIGIAAFEELWTDAESVLPEDRDEEIWWEFWISILPNRRRQDLNGLREKCKSLGVQLSESQVNFEERSVVLARCTRRQIETSLELLSGLAEIRRTKETAEFFDSLDIEAQKEWLDSLLKRIEFNDAIGRICILDTGVNRSHPILENCLREADLHTVNPGWDVSDSTGHGTGVASSAAFGDLTGVLSSDETISIDWSLESVKILNSDQGNEGAHFGYLTEQAVYLAEIAAPDASRIFNSTVTSRDGRDFGRPSSWSAAIDKLCFGENNIDQRLFVLSAGNIFSNTAWGNSPASNAEESIHDPGQSFNAITVGAYTELSKLTENEIAEGLVPVVSSGQLSPFSSTSVIWDNHWPLKPDVVFEGGNAANDGIGAVWTASLSLLTAAHDITTRLFTTTNATSASAALATKFLSNIQTAYPNKWPETYRGLIVHSASWTPQMQESFLPNRRKRTVQNLVRHCGYGSPSLEDALWSARNQLTLISEQNIQPFSREDGNSHATLNEMHLYDLPWPKAELEALGEEDVEMRVTLSYFIEPSPSARGIKGRYRYESHGLRFDVMRPEENIEQFRARINENAHLEDEPHHPAAADADWVLGPHLRHRGSIHSDIWRGSATQLASRGAIAIYPTAGWWKTRLSRNKANNQTRYALIVSIRTKETEVDIYTPVRNQLSVSIET